MCYICYRNNLQEKIRCMFRFMAIVYTLIVCIIGLTGMKKYYVNCEDMNRDFFTEEEIKKAKKKRKRELRNFKLWILKRILLCIILIIFAVYFVKYLIFDLIPFLMPYFEKFVFSL